MYTTKTGQKYGSSYVGKKKDSMHAGDDPSAASGPKSTTMGFGQPKKGSVPKEEPRTDAMGETNKTAYPGVEQVDNTADTKASPEGVDAGAVAAEHGPASSVTVHHSKDAHTVVSRHPSGHLHTSQHKSHADAHAAAAQLSGEQHTENNDKPANDEQMSGGDLYGNNDGFKMPKLA